MSLMGSAPVGQPDDLEAVPELAVGGLEERLFEAAGVPVREVDADHGREEAPGGIGGSPLSTNQTTSAGLCIRLVTTRDH
jgi:hypothetical protein